MQTTAPGNSATDNAQTTDIGGNVPSIMDIMGSMDAADAKAETAPETADGGGEGNDEADEQKKQDGKLPAWMSQLSKEALGDESLMNQLKKFGKIEDVAKSYAELEKKLGRSTSIPDENSSREDREMFWQKIGKPKSAADYDLPKDQDTDAFRKLAHENNLTEDQAKGIYAALRAYGEKTRQDMAAAMRRQASETESSLKAQYGAKTGEALADLKAGVLAYGGKELGAKLKSTGLLYDPDFVNLFIRLGRMAGEAKVPGKSGGPGGNDYVSTANGGTFSHKGLKNNTGE